MKNLKTLGIKTIINLRAFYSDSDKIRETGLLVEELSVEVWHIEDADVVRVLRIIRKRENGPFLTTLFEWLRIESVLWSRCLGW